LTPGFGMNSMKYMNDNQDCKPAIDMVTLGERGQVVIPAAIREQLGLKAGDKLMVFIKHGKLIGLVPPDSFRHWVDKMTQQLSDLETKKEGN
jgi:AbrB family looped-hinge helix DNA binding protein